MTSESFLKIIYNNYINVLDIGSGPAVASLAIADLAECIVKILHEEGKINTKVIFNFVLNDTSDICIGLGKEVLFDFFQRLKSSHNIFLRKAFFLSKRFPQSIIQFRRITKNLNPFSLVVLSYILNPLNQQGVDIKSSIMDLKEVCIESGQIFVLQDKYNGELINQIESDVEKRSVIQTIYSEQNKNDIYTYEYYRGLITSEELCNAIT